MATHRLRIRNLEKKMAALGKEYGWLIQTFCREAEKFGAGDLSGIFRGAVPRDIPYRECIVHKAPEACKAVQRGIDAWAFSEAEKKEKYCLLMAWAENIFRKKRTYERMEADINLLNAGKAPRFGPWYYEPRDDA